MMPIVEDDEVFLGFLPVGNTKIGTSPSFSDFAAIEPYDSLTSLPQNHLGAREVL